MAKRPPLPGRGSSFPLRVRTREPDYRMPADFNYSANRPCGDNSNKLARGQCLVQLTFDQGMPALRFCTEKGKPGPLVHVESPSEAAEAARLVCTCFEETGSLDNCLPEGLKLGGVRKARRRRKWAMQGKYCVMRGGRKLSCHDTKAAANAAAKASRERCKSAKGAARCKGRTTVKVSR